MATVVYRIGDDISTDVIYPGRYMATVLPTETPQFAFADDAAFNGMLKAGHVAKGSVIVAGGNFAWGPTQACGAPALPEDTNRDGPDPDAFPSSRSPTPWR